MACGFCVYLRDRKKYSNNRKNLSASGSLRDLERHAGLTGACGGGGTLLGGAAEERLGAHSHHNAARLAGGYARASKSDVGAVGRGCHGIFQALGFLLLHVALAGQHRLVEQQVVGGLRTMSPATSSAARIGFSPLAERTTWQVVPTRRCR